MRTDPALIQNYCYDGKQTENVVTDGKKRKN